VSPTQGITKDIQRPMLFKLLGKKENATNVRVISCNSEGALFWIN
jgi:hypothetical protein